VKLQQLEYVVEIVNHDNHLSAAAAALHTSQPGVSRQLQMLESELGIAIFARTKNRIVGLTEPGQIVVDTARRILSEAASLARLKTDLAEANTGKLTIATTHTHANYVLPNVIRSFIADFPQVQLVLLQGDPQGICDMVAEGEADLAVGTDGPHVGNLVELPCFELQRVVVAPEGHPILSVEELTLEEIARYPLITYDSRFSGFWRVHNAMQRANLKPHVVLSAIDAGVCKTYLRMGLGIAVLSSITYDAETDVGLRARDARHLFESSTTYIRMRANMYPTGYLLSFVQRLAPRYTSDVIRARLREAQTQATATTSR
jgi:LysR family cys regulon transcriptional activator